MSFRDAREEGKNVVGFHLVRCMLNLKLYIGHNVCHINGLLIKIDGSRDGRLMRWQNFQCLAHFDKEREREIKMLTSET